MDIFSQVNKLEKRIKAATEKHVAAHSKLMELAYTAFKLVMDSPAMQVEVKRLVAEVEKSRDLTQDESSEWLMQYAREDFHGLIDSRNQFQRELLGRYLSEDYNVRADFKNGVALYDIGPCIVIDAEDGDIYDQDSHKVIIKRDEYLRENGEGRGTEDHELRNRLIEAYMEKTGYFPSVVKMDRYGNAYYVDTRSPEAKAKVKAA